MAQDILIVDDEADIRELISDVLTDEGFATRAANDSCQAIEAIEERVPTAVVLDIWLQGSQMDGLGILENIKQKYPNLPVIMISGHGNIETAIQSIRLGAYDFIEKPFKEDKLLHLLNRAIEAARLREENEQLRLRGTPETTLIGKSAAVTQLTSTIDRVATTSSRVLITGPAGCGKEVVARLIHSKSKRADAPFVVLNAASISPNHIEEELFGTEDADTILGSEGAKKVGTFEKAHGGTLFIDEVADMPIAVQGKILRLLQENSFERPGSGKRVKVDVRVIAASNKNLQKVIELGKLREDLFYRLNVVPIRVPSLRERKEDIKPLAEYFIQRCSSMLGVAQRSLSEEVIAAMETYDWPGNVRQLRNVIEWLLIMATGDPSEPIGSDALPPEILSKSPSAIVSEMNSDIISMPLRAAREVFEKRYLSAQLARFDGNISKTALFVGMERSALHRKLKLLGVSQNDEELAGAGV